MKKLFFTLIIVFVLGLTYQYTFGSTEDSRQSNPDLKGQDNTKPTKTPENYTPTEVESVFVPYWNIPVSGTNLRSYDRIMYFGIKADSNGVDTNEEGYVGLNRFNSLNWDGEKLLTLRMLDAQENLIIFDDSNLQQSIIAETIAAAEEYDFDGIVLDLEMGGTLPIGDTSEEISSFVSLFNSEIKKHQLADGQNDGNTLHFAVLIYGDVFYRSRPFDVETISDSADEVMIMAYDFHKSRGEPGPNFPLTGRETYGYDFQTMINDFNSIVSPEKLTVIFGKFGYNWTLGQQGLPLKQAESQTLQNIKDSFLDSCQFQSCRSARDDMSSEQVVRYIDRDGYEHVVWFEDEKSVAEKNKLLQNSGIDSIGYWVWGYY